MTNQREDRSFNFKVGDVIRGRNSGATYLLLSVEPDEYTNIWNCINQFGEIAHCGDGLISYELICSGRQK